MGRSILPMLTNGHGVSVLLVSPKPLRRLTAPPLLEVKRTWRRQGVLSAFDPKRSLYRSYTAELLHLSKFYTRTPISPMRLRNRDPKRLEIGHAYHYTKATDWFPQVAVEKSRAPYCAALQPGALKHRN
jgi:hypothetical protein